MKFSTMIVLFFAAILAVIGYKQLTAEPTQQPIKKIVKPIVYGTNDPRIIELKKEIEATMKSLLSTINSVSDTVSAQKAVAPLTKVSTDLNSYLDRMKRIPDDDKIQIKNYMMDFVKYLKDPLERLSKVPGAAKIINPAINKIDTVLMFYKPM